METESKWENLKPRLKSVVRNESATTLTEDFLAASQEKINLDGDTIATIVHVLESGSELVKIRGFNRRYRRKYMVDFEDQRLFYMGSTKNYCLKPTNYITFRNIHDVRRGWRTDSFNKFAAQIRRKPRSSPNLQEENCLSIIYGPRKNSLDLVCPDPKVCDVWVQGLAYFLAKQKGMESEQTIEAWLRRTFRQADKDRSDTLNFEETLSLVGKLNMHINEQDARNHFDECMPFKIFGEDVLDEKGFVKFYRLLDERSEIKEIFEKYSAQTCVWGPLELQAFLKEDEKMDWITRDIARAQINEVESGKCFKSLGYMTYEAFEKLLRSDKMDMYNYDHQQTVYQDMSQPLNHYYISSSHNTYLLANQLTGKSSMEGYINALKNGCRCVELDLWDGADGEPKITHGHTLTSEIDLKDVLITAIEPLAFTNSEFPLILSVENHLSVEQQKIAAYHFKNILADKLYLQPIASDMRNLPSPQELKYKVIIKGKKSVRRQSQDSATSQDNDVDEAESQTVICKEFSDLVNICSSVPFHGFKTKKESFFEMASIQEKKALSLLDTSTNNFIQHTQNQLVRIYPSNLRQDSSNFNPIPFWNVGCQMVALNYQTNCSAMLYNRSKFQDNGRCGYVLKPKCLLTAIEVNDDTDDEDEQSSVDSADSLLQLQGTKKELTIKVISAQRLPKISVGDHDITDPYVVVNIEGHNNDEQTAKTLPIHNNGFNPIWNETFTFTINFWELAFLNLEVWDSNMLKDGKIGEFSVPCTSIQEGYRHVHLFRSQHPGTLFVHVKIKDLEPQEVVKEEEKSHSISTLV